MNLDNSIKLALFSLKEGGLSDITKESLELRLISEFESVFVEDVTTKLKRSSIFDMEFRPIQYILAPKKPLCF